MYKEVTKLNKKKPNVNMGKRYLTKKHVISLAIRKIQNNKPRQLTTTQPFEWLKQKHNKTTRN